MEILTGVSIGENSTSAQQRRNLLQAYERKFKQLSEDHKLSKLWSDAGLKFVEQGQFFYTLETEEGQQMQHLCREYTMPRNEKEDSCEMMDSQEFENRPSLEHESLPSWRSIQYWSSCPVSVSRQKPLLGLEIRERCWYIRDRIDANQERRGHSFGETHCQSKTKTEAHRNVDIRLYSCSWKEMVRHWNTTITRSEVIWSVQSHHPIAATWSISPSRKRRSDPLQWHHRRVQDKEVRRWFAMVTWKLDINSGRREEERRKDFNIVWIQTLPINSCTFEQFKDIQETNAVDPTLQDSVLLPKGFTEYIYHVWNANELNSITRNGLIPGGTSLKIGRQAVFFHCSESDGGRIFAWVKLHAIWRNQGSRQTRILGNDFKIKYFGAIWSSLKRKTCNLTEHGHMQSFSTTHCLAACT